MEAGIQRENSEVRQHTGWKGNGSCLRLLDRLCSWRVGLRKRWLGPKSARRWMCESWRCWEPRQIWGRKVTSCTGIPIVAFKYTCTRDSSVVISSASTMGSDSVDLGRTRSVCLGCVGTLKACLGWKATAWNAMFSLPPSLFSLLFFLWLSICYWQIHGSNLLKELWKLMNKQKSKHFTSF